MAKLYTLHKGVVFEVVTDGELFYAMTKNIIPIEALSSETQEGILSEIFCKTNDILSDKDYAITGLMTIAERENVLCGMKYNV